MFYYQFMVRNSAACVNAYQVDSLGPRGSDKALAVVAFEVDTAHDSAGQVIYGDGCRFVGKQHHMLVSGIGIGDDDRCFGMYWCGDTYLC